MIEKMEVLDDGTNNHDVRVQVRHNTKADTYIPYSKSPTIPDECKRNIELEKEDWEKECRGPESPDDLKEGWVGWRAHETQQSARKAADDINQEAALDRWFREWNGKHALVVRARTIEQIEAE
jgi:hypothetical protein